MCRYQEHYFAKKSKKSKIFQDFRQLMALEWVGVPPAPPIKNPSMKYMIPAPSPSVYWNPR